MGDTNFDSVAVPASGLKVAGTAVTATAAQQNKLSGADTNAKVVYEQHATVARTDTAAKNLFTLPAGAVPLGFSVYGSAVSDAGTTATVGIGKTGSNTFFVSGFDVKGSTGSGLQSPTAQSNLMASVGGSAIQVVGIYAETGGASTTGGPWTVRCLYEV